MRFTSMLSVLHETRSRVVGGRLARSTNYTWAMSFLITHTPPPRIYGNRSFFPRWCWWWVSISEHLRASDRPAARVHCKSHHLLSDTDVCSSVNLLLDTFRTLFPANRMLQLAGASVVEYIVFGVFSLQGLRHLVNVVGRLGKHFYSGV